MILLLDIGNSRTHLGLGDAHDLKPLGDLATPTLGAADGASELERLVGDARLDGAVLCSVVPRATSVAEDLIRRLWRVVPLAVSAATVPDLGLDYPRPETIGPDRLANAVAALHRYGAPCVVIDFGTAVTFDVINRRGEYAGGIIAPGLSAMTDYLHERTALLPRIEIREVTSVIGKSTEEAMLIGAVHGYRGLIRELIREIRDELGNPGPRIAATGGYAELIATGLAEIERVEPNLTLEGLRLIWQRRAALASEAARTR